MISERNYNKHIYNTITGLIFNFNDNYQVRQQSDNECVLPEHIRKTLSEIADKYDYDMKKKYLINMEFISEWQKSVIGYTDVESALIASEYIVFCCVVDKILDSRRFSYDFKISLLKYIIIDSFISDIPLTNDEKELECVFNLVTDIRHFLNQYSGGKKNDLMCEIEKALASECFMSTHDLKYDISKNDVHFLIDKSVCFESSALKMSLLPFDTHSDSQAHSIGEIFWLIDDICDLLDDYKNGRINSLLYYNNNADHIDDRLVYAVEHIDFIIIQLKEKVDLFKLQSNVTMHEFIKEQIWWWLSDARRLSGL